MNYVKELKEKHNFSKWKIAHLIGVSWNTINLWDREVYQPNEEHKRKLEELYVQNKTK